MSDAEPANPADPGDVADLQPDVDLSRYTLASVTAVATWCAPSA